MGENEPLSSGEVSQKHDSFAKELFDRVLSHWGEVHLNLAVLADTQYIDVYFEPTQVPDHTDPRLALLAQMCQDPCLFEPFRKLPTREDVRDCLDKHFTLHRKRSKPTDGAKPSRPARLWLLSPGHPQTLLNNLKASPSHSWPSGFFSLPSALNTGLIAIRLLPEEPQTLIFRLMGQGPTQERALAELMRYHPNEPVTRAIWELAVKWSIDDDHDLDMTLELHMDSQRRHKIYETWKQNTLAQGRQEGLLQGLEQGIEQGLEQGIEQGLEQGIERGQQQAARKTLLTVYQARFGDVPDEIQSVVEGTQTLERLEQWITLFATATPPAILDAIRH